MPGSFIDNLLFSLKSPPDFGERFIYLDTDFGKIRAFDTKGNKPVIINVPDGPNVIEHQLLLIKELSKNFRVVCFEYPGMGFSFPNSSYDYSFESGAKLLMQVTNILDLDRPSLLFSCSNGYYAIQAAVKNPDIFNHIFLSQTPSAEGIYKWADSAIPDLLQVPVIGQIANGLFSKKLVQNWYKISLPKSHPKGKEYTRIATSSLNKGGCFCLSSLVQGLKKDRNTSLQLSGVPTTLVWGALDHSHRHTDKESIRRHIDDCEIIEFKNSGHFPELEKQKEYVNLINERVKR